MRRILMVLFVFAAMASFAQKKPKISAAETAWKEGDFATAKGIVDAAIAHEKTMDDTKSWFMRGLVYASMDTAGMAEGDLKIAKEAFDKARDLKGGGGENFITTGGFPLPQSQVETNYWAFYINQGIDAFQKEDSEAALTAFTKSAILVPDSIDSYYYAGLAAITSKKNDVAYDNFKVYIDGGGDEIDAYERQAYLIANHKGEKIEALAFIRAAQQKYPDAKSLDDWEFRLLFDLDMVDEAVTALEDAIASDPTNPELLFNLGVMLERTEQLERAKEAYEKALEIDPEYYNAIFNLGVFYRNQLVDLASEKNDLGISKADQAREKQLNTEIAEASKMALPYWEKAESMKPEDRTTLETLQYIYVQIREYDKAEAIQNKMRDLGYLEGGN